jgi:hypothetical protein
MILLCFRGGGDDLGHVDGVAFALQQQAARRMAEHRDLRMRERFADAFGHLLGVHGEALVDAGDDVVEQRERLVVEIERAVARMSHSVPKKMRKSFLGELHIELLDLLGLLADAFLVEAVGLTLGFAVVGDAEIFAGPNPAPLVPWLRRSRCRRSTSSDSGTCRGDSPVRSTSAACHSPPLRSRPCLRAVRVRRSRA